jgi:hypothetical protein
MGLFGRDDRSEPGRKDPTSQAKPHRSAPGERAPSGLVEGKIAARSIIVAGRVIGDLLAAERIELGSSCTMEGNITAPRIQIHDGATFDGQVLMKKPSGWNAGADSGSITTSSARRAASSKPPDAPDTETL